MSSIINFTEDEKTLLISLLEERKKLIETYSISKMDKDIILNSLDRLEQKIQKSLNVLEKQTSLSKRIIENKTCIIEVSTPKEDISSVPMREGHGPERTPLSNTFSNSIVQTTSKSPTFSIEKEESKTNLLRGKNLGREIQDYLQKERDWIEFRTIRDAFKLYSVKTIYNQIQNMISNETLISKKEGMYLLVKLNGLKIR